MGFKRNSPGCGCGCGGSGGTTIGIPGCVCQNTPASLTCTITYGPGEDAHSYSNAYQSCTIGYFTTPPSYLPQSAFAGVGYYSTEAWTDDYGFTDYYRLDCYTSQWSLSFGQNNLGIWQSPVPIYNWSMATRCYDSNGQIIDCPPDRRNYCDPLLLQFGHPQQGIVFYGKIVISG